MSTIIQGIIIFMNEFDYIFDMRTTFGRLVQLSVCRTDS